VLGQNNSQILTYYWDSAPSSPLQLELELELELYFYLNTVNLSDKIIILKPSEKCWD